MASLQAMEGGHFSFDFTQTTSKYTDCETSSVMNGEDDIPACCDR